MSHLKTFIFKFIILQCAKKTMRNLVKIKSHFNVTFSFFGLIFSDT